MSKLTLTLISATKPPVLSKSFSLLEDGTLEKKPGGNLVSGWAQTLIVSLQEFHRGLKSLKPHEAFVYGVCGHEKAKIVPQQKLKRARSSEVPVIARDREHFSYPEGPAILMLDYDPPGKGSALNRDELLQILYRTWPDLKSCPHIWAPSASSCIFRIDTNTELRGTAGQRVYIPVPSGTDIPRVGPVLFSRLWLAGHGWFDVSKSGALLERSVIDAAVWQPERLDFAGGAACEDGLEQRRPEPVLYNGDATFIDSLSLPDLTPEEKKKLEEIKTQARNAKKPAVEQQREIWIKERLTNLPPGKAEQYRGIFESAAKKKRLLSDFVLISAAHGKVTVATILDNPDKYHGDRFADPLEPDYGGDMRIAWANLRAAGRPYIWSWAHGGQKFTLHRARENVQIEGGELPQIVDRVLELMRLDGAVFDHGGELVRIAGGEVFTVTPEWLQLYLTSLCQFEKYDKRNDAWKRIDCPKDLGRTILSMAGIWNLSALKGVLTAPTITPDGRIVDIDGYDDKTGMYLDLGDFSSWKSIPDDPSETMVREALQTLWHPFKDFPFESNCDRSCALAACLTIPVRPLLPTAPGICINSPVAGTGKTLMARAFAQLSGTDGEVLPNTDTDEEMRKRLLSFARMGSPIMIFDNISGAFASDSLCAYLTCEYLTDRVLGASTIVSGRTNSTVILTGNNPSIVGDLNRRLLKIRINPNCEKPFLRTFKIDPASYVRENRFELVRAALIVLRAAVRSGFKHDRGRLASFEIWSDFVRNAVIWVSQNDWMNITDPVGSIEQSYVVDNETRRLGTLLTTWHEEFGARGGTVSEAIKNAKRYEKNDSGNFDLFSVLDDIAGERGVLNPRRLGNWIERHEGRIVAGRRFVRNGISHHATVWVVELEGSLDELGEFRYTQHGKWQNDNSIYRGIETPNTPLTPLNSEVVTCSACANFRANPTNPAHQGSCLSTPPDGDRSRFPNLSIDCPEFREGIKGMSCAS
jgi:hypothetical protein